ncbi:MAG: hypothetical protein ACI8XV_000795 [Arenicella sp.]|jgi:hypothetical protein
MGRFSSAIEKQKRVPELQMGIGASGGSSSVTLIDMMGVKAAKDLTLDRQNQNQKSNMLSTKRPVS